MLIKSKLVEEKENEEVDDDDDKNTNAQANDLNETRVI